MVYPLYSMIEGIVSQAGWQIKQSEPLRIPLIAHVLNNLPKRVFISCLEISMTISLNMSWLLSHVLFVE